MHERVHILDSRDALEAFFDGCDARERGEEPDWALHRRVIEESIRSGVDPAGPTSAA